MAAAKRRRISTIGNRVGDERGDEFGVYTTWTSAMRAERLQRPVQRHPHGDLAHRQA